MDEPQLYAATQIQITNSSVSQSQKTINKSKEIINTKFRMEDGERTEVDVGYCLYLSP